MSEAQDSALKAAAAHWSAQAVPESARSNWWEHPTIVRYVNRRTCGLPLDGLMAGDVMLLSRLLDGETAKRGVSVGCGVAAKELVLLRRGLVEHFDLYEISAARIRQATKAAKEHGMGDRITWHNEPADFQTADGGGYDLVYWNNSLHHMLDTRQALAWSREVLSAEGLLYMNDFVGPDRMQWPDEMLAAATRVREALPPRLLQTAEGRDLPTEVARPDPEALAAMDPTECADSAAILPAIDDLFEDATVTPTGGVVYHLALKGVLERLGPKAIPLFDLLLLIDELHADAGMTHYAVAYNRPGLEALA